MAQSMGETFKSIRERIETASPKDFFLPLLALIIVAGALVIGSGRGGGGAGGGEGGGGVPEPGRQPLAMDRFIPVIPKTFKVEVEYSTATKKLSLKDVSVLSEEMLPDNRLALFSPYEIAFFDKNFNQLYKSHASISESVIIERDPGSVQTTQPAYKLLSVIYVPYNYSAARMVIYRNSRQVINISLPENSRAASSGSESSIAQAPTCDKMNVSFISDGYAGNYTKFHSDVEIAKNAIATTPPYETLAASLRYNVFDNDQDLGCASGGIEACAINSGRVLDAMGQALAKYPGTGSYIIMSNGGGRSAAYFHRFAVINSSNTANVPFLARHEFLGHTLGLLYDRYLTGAPLEGDIRSNCTDIPAGEPWWGTAGSTGQYSGCTSNSFYAPYQNTCAGGGNPNTLMALCGGGVFDPVEKYWLTEYRIPSILSCTGGPPPSSGAPGAGGGAPNGPKVISNLPSCSNQAYSVILEWTGSGQGWFLDISTDPNFGGYANKDVSGLTQLAVPKDFPNVTLDPDIRYYTRLYYGVPNNWAQGDNFLVPTCSGGGGGGGGGAQTHSATISWNAMSSAVNGYQVVYVAGTTNTGIRNTTGTSMTFNGLEAGSYSWTIWAIGADNNRTGENSGAGRLVP